jgi:glycosyltransferase involved in cell wall biosynthesis
VCAPSLYEPWGFVLTEAMAHGVPCIGTTVQSVPEILDHGRAGILVPPSDVDALAEAIVTLLEDDLLASRLAAHGRRRVEQHYTWDRVVDAMAPALTSVRRGELTPQQMGPP